MYNNCDVTNQLISQAFSESRRICCSHWLYASSYDVCGALKKEQWVRRILHNFLTITSLWNLRFLKTIKHFQKIRFYTFTKHTKVFPECYFSLSIKYPGVLFSRIGDHNLKLPNSLLESLPSLPQLPRGAKSAHISQAWPTKRHDS